jgi:hypothetical protein
MQRTKQKQVEQVSVEQDTFSVDVESGASVDASGLQESLTEIADTFDVTGFKCVKCGLAHMHDTTKHQLSKDFDISDEDSAQAEYNPVCHCGVQEAGRHGSEMGVDEQSAASVADNAPIPPEASREMNEQFGSL